MATRSEEVDAAWAEVDNATNSLAGRVQALIDEINRTATEGLSGPQTEALLARLTALKGTLSAMGQDPSMPIPEASPDLPIPGPFRPEA